MLCTKILKSTVRVCVSPKSLILIPKSDINVIPNHKPSPQIENDNNDNINHNSSNKQNHSKQVSNLESFSKRCNILLQSQNEVKNWYTSGQRTVKTSLTSSPSTWTSSSTAHWGQGNLARPTGAMTRDLQAEQRSCAAEESMALANEFGIWQLGHCNSVTPAPARRFLRQPPHRKVRNVAIRESRVNRGSWGRREVKRGNGFGLARLSVFL